MTHKEHKSLIAAKRMQAEPFDDDLLDLIDQAVKDKQEPVNQDVQKDDES